MKRLVSPIVTAVAASTLSFNALLLFIFTFAVNSVAEWVRQRLRDKYRAL